MSIEIYTDVLNIIGKMNETVLKVGQASGHLNVLKVRVEKHLLRIVCGNIYAALALNNSPIKLYGTSYIYTISAYMIQDII